MKIILYGMGEFGEHAIHRIEKYYPNYQVDGVIDSFRKLSGQGIQQISIDSVCDKSIPIVITISKRRTVVEIYKKLKSFHFENVYVYLRRDNIVQRNSDFLENECKKIIGLPNEIIPHIEMHAVDYCNLKCKACIHFSPLFLEDDFCKELIFEDMNKMAKLSRNVLSLYIMGGEPFLRDDLDEVLSYARKMFATCDIELLSNGLLIPTCSEKVLKSIYDNNIHVVISEYEPTKKIRERIIRVLEQNNISYSIRGHLKKEKFVKSLSYSEDSIYPHGCICDGCVNLYKGKVARCPAVMYIDRLNSMFNLTFPREGTFDIEEIKSVEELNEKMNDMIPLCKHCVLCEIEWERCGSTVSIQDFVVME